MASVYVVRKGDTLTKIAEKYNTTVTALAELNRINNPDVIRVGQVLTLPEKKAEKPAEPDIKEMFQQCVSDIEKLPSFQRFLKVL